MERNYNIRNLNCAHCAGKIEAAINELSEIDSAIIVFASKKLKIKGNITDSTLKLLNDTARKIEADVEIIPENEKNEEKTNLKKEILISAIGIIFYAAAPISGKLTDLSALCLGFYIISYLILGFEILLSTLKNIAKGKLFDENFLMALATLGAFALGEYSEAVGVVLFFKIGEIFEKYAVEKSRKAINAAASLKVNEVDLLVDGEFVRCSSDDVKIGSIIRVKPGERIAVDGIIENGESRIDTSAISGEPVPVSVKKGDEIMSGCINLSSAITVKATAAAADSMISKIAEAVENAAASKPKIDRFITRFAAIYTPIVILAAALTAIIPSLITGEWSKWIYTALTFLVISCPCALVLSVPLAYFSGIGAASKHGILFKSGCPLEALGKIKAVVFDKTGTVTSGTFDVTDIQSLGSITENELLSLCGSCEQASTHPAAVSIVKYCLSHDIPLVSAENIRELSGRGVSAEINSRPILCGNKRLMNENNIEVHDENTKIAGTVVYVSRSGELIGRIVVSDSVKEKSAEAVSQFRKMGLSAAMLTGDNVENAEIIGKSLGIDYIKGGLLPEDKLSEIKEIRRRYGSVMFIGDGINDGPVLAGADVGAAMMNGSDLALEAADVIFMNQELDSAVTAKKIADKTLRISYQNIIFALAFKAAVLLLGIAGYASMWFAVFADSGVAALLILNSIRILRTDSKYLSS